MTEYRLPNTEQGSDRRVANLTNECACLVSCQLWPRAVTAAAEAALTAGGYKDTAK